MYRSEVHAGNELKRHANCIKYINRVNFLVKIMKISWQNKKDKLMQKFASVKGKDLNYRIGREKEMMKRLRVKLGKTEEEILSIIINL